MAIALHQWAATVDAVELCHFNLTCGSKGDAPLLVAIDARRNDEMTTLQTFNDAIGWRSITQEVPS